MEALDKYKECAILDSNGRVSLVLCDKRVYVRKIVDFSSGEIYKKIFELDSDNFPKIKEIVNCGDYYVVVEQYISGCTIGELIKNKGVLDEDTAVGYIAEVLKAVGLLHKKGIIHRDITENNVMLTDDGKIKLIDFNISHKRDKAKTRDTVVMGTNGYAAPEQFGFSRSDERTDIYSIGVLFNYMLMGCTDLGLYGGKPKLVAMIDKCTRFEPKNRYSSCSEVLAELGCCKSACTDIKKKFFEILFWVCAACEGILILAFVKSVRSGDDVLKSARLIVDGMVFFILPFPTIGNWMDWQSYTPLKYMNRLSRTVATTVIYILVFVAYILLSSNR